MIHVVVSNVAQDPPPCVFPLNASIAEECCYRRQLAHEEQSRTPRDVFWGGPVTLEVERPSK